MSNHADETDDDESMITPAMEAAIGREGDPVTATITRELVRRMAEALDEGDAELLAALESDDATPEVPGWALFVHFGRYRQPELPDAPPRGLMAADELTLLAPIHVGDELTVVSRIAGMNERIGGRVGARPVRRSRMDLHQPARGRGRHDAAHRGLLQAEALGRVSACRSRP